MYDVTISIVQFNTFSYQLYNRRFYDCRFFSQFPNLIGSRLPGIAVQSLLWLPHDTHLWFSPIFFSSKIRDHWHIHHTCIRNGKDYKGAMIHVIISHQISFRVTDLTYLISYHAILLVIHRFIWLVYTETCSRCLWYIVFFTKSPIEHSTVIARLPKAVKVLKLELHHPDCLLTTSVASITVTFISPELEQEQVKRRNTIGCLDKHMCRGLRLWNSRDCEAV